MSYGLRFNLIKALAHVSKIYINGEVVTKKLNLAQKLQILVLRDFSNVIKKNGNGDPYKGLLNSLKDRGISYNITDEFEELTL